MEYRLLFLLLLLLSISAFLQLKPLTATTTTQTTSSSSPYLSSSLFLPNYQKMLQNFKIYIYNDINNQTTFPSNIESLFHTSLLESSFITKNPNEAHFFYLYFSPSSSYKSISGKIKDLQIQYPFWNRTLGADHFYLSCNGIGYESDRNIVELKKNSVQISCFSPMKNDESHRFIPHKDLSLPPMIAIDLQMDTVNIVPISKKKYFGYFNNRDIDNLDPVIDFIEELRNDPDFMTDTEPYDYDWVSNIKFCLFFFTDKFVSISGFEKALRYGCVPVVITDRSIVNLPFVDVLKWTEIAVFVDIKGGLKNLQKVVGHRCEGEKYEKMRELGMKASKHFVWNHLSPQPHDAFYSVLYQLWLRRHTIRYTRREII
ncbi:hypothetical protein AQUCO_00600421v1 [Aquilegia coerulea]|uniref:Exostosin GT47 domain-containing protein n=1 Tax=Aquilegia coerulea TaxID=218851 RepID=A0A2G5EPI6_AQUCA|nr:hypothetical protein AQUCO_00600421v1 [Aquilegia coerulea]